MDIAAVGSQVRSLPRRLAGTTVAIVGGVLDIVRRIVPRLVLAGLVSVTATGCLIEAFLPSSGGDCTTQVDKTISLQTPADPPMDLRVESCRVDVDACPALCSLAMSRANIQNAPTACKAEFQGDTVDLKVSYIVQGSGPNCPVEDFAPANAGAGGVK